MAKLTGPKCRLCRRLNVKLFLKGARCATKKCAVEKERPVPGQHGGKRSRMTDYGVHLREVQRLKRLYGLLDRQLRRFYDEAVRTPGDTGDNLLVMLERRLDNVVTRLGFATSRAQARQMITHGHLRVNRRRAYSPSMLLSAGDEIDAAPGERSKKIVNEGYATMKTQQTPPSWLRVEEGDPLKGVVIQLPKRDDIAVPFDPLAVVEFMSI